MYTFLPPNLSNTHDLVPNSIYRQLIWSDKSLFFTITLDSKYFGDNTWYVILGSTCNRVN